MTPKFNIVGLMIQDTGTYSQQVSRPYQAVTQGYALDSLTRRIEDVSRNDPLAKINGTLISGLSTSLVSPVAAWERKLYIPNGWEEPRLHFALEVHLDTHFGTEIYFFQGYTEYKDVSLMSGHINPDMMFFINSFLRVNRSQDHSGLSSMGYRDVIVESAQVIDGQIHSMNYDMNQNLGMGHQSVYTLRPEDIFTGIQGSYLTQYAAGINEPNILDDRQDQSHSAIRSRRANGIPSNFLSSVVGNYRSASMLADMGQGSDDVYGRAIQSSWEGRVYENPFIHALSEMKGSPGGADITHFTVNDLSLLDPTIGQKTHYNELMPTVRLSSHGDTGNNWLNATRETQIATILTHAVAGLMTQNMLVAVAFSSTNMTITGEFHTEFMPDLGQAVTTADMRMFYANFQQRLETEVMPDLVTPPGGGIIPIHVIVTANLYSETRIELSIDGAPHEIFVTPSFCDSITSPIVTTDINAYHGLVTGIEEIVNSCNIQGLPNRAHGIINSSI